MLATTHGPQEWLFELVINPHSLELRRHAALLLRIMASTPDRELRVLDALLGLLDASVASASGYSLQLLALIKQLASSPDARIFLVARGAIPLLCRHVCAEAYRLQQSEQELLFDSFQLPVMSASTSVLPQWAAEMLELLVAHSAQARTVFMEEEHLSVSLEALVVLKQLVLTSSMHIEEAAVILQFLACNAKSEPNKRAFLRASSQVLDRVSFATVGFLLERMNEVILPPPRVPAFRIQLRRAPTQEEFFRGALTKNPIGFGDLLESCDTPEPTMSDLRAKVARDLEMEDAAELLELLVCNQIVNPTLPVRFG